MYGHGIRPWELAAYTWREVVLTKEGITQSNNFLREAAHLIHSSLLEEKNRIKKERWMPMPLDADPEEVELQERVMKRKAYMEIKQKLIEKEKLSANGS